MGESLFYAVQPDGSARRGRPPGRPVGAKSAVVRDIRLLGIHHFAFLRACFLGFEPREAFSRYLAWAETTTDLRHIQHRRTELLRQITDAARRLDASLPAESKVTKLIDLLRTDIPATPVTSLPSLDEWLAAEGLEDMYSEAEALSEYQAAFGLDNPDALEAAEKLADPGKERVKALNTLSSLLSVAPSPTDLVDAWFAASVVKALRLAGILTLTDLVQLINLYGYRWHFQVRGFGRVRAQQTVAWLHAQSESLQLSISEHTIEPKSKRALRRGVSASQLVIPQRFGLVPLERLALPPALSGSQGVYRSHLANTLEANNDLEAITRWLNRYNERRLTLASYRREIERFVLWCTTVQKKPVSSASSVDCQDYRAFIKNIPWDWIHKAPVGRTDPAWRPFRGQLNEASQKQALVIVQTMFEGLRDAGYLVANPMRQVMKGFALPSSRIHITRSFTEAEWTHVLRTLEQESAGPNRTRLRCALELLVSSGIRLDELAKARHRDLRLESLPDLPDTWILTVTGKRQKTREVPIANDVVALLREHAADGCTAGDDVSQRPLLLALNTSVPQWTLHAQNLQTLVTKPLTFMPGAGMSNSGIYACLKRFFGRAAQTAAAADLDPLRFEKASTHWMRHTFVRQALVDGAPIEVVSELAGHASIDTTSIYSTQELARKVAVVRRLRRSAV